MSDRQFAADQWAGVGRFLRGQDHLQAVLLVQIRLQGVKAALERPFFASAVRRCRAADEPDLSVPGGRKIIVFCPVIAPKQPVFFLCENFFLAGKQVDAQLEVFFRIVGFSGRLAA